MRNTTLVVQSDPDVLSATRMLLEAEGHEVVEADTVADAKALWRGSPPDAVLVQWTGAQDLRGLLEAMGRRNGSGPCVIVTASDAQLPAAVVAFDLGADDCIRVPLDKVEFAARLNAALKRRLGTHPERLSAGPLVLDKAVHCLCIEDKSVNLAPTEFRLLAFFLEHKGRVFTREEILRGAWKRNIHTGSRTVDVHVRRLRQILEPYGCADMIQTVRSFGYRFAERS